MSNAPTIFAGMDRWECPDQRIMQSLFDWTNLWWTGFYLGPNYNWSDKYEMLTKMGWGVLPIYWAKQPNGYCAGIKKEKLKQDAKKGAKFDVAACKGYNELQGDKDEAFEFGVSSGEEAARFARQAKIPRNTIIYLDCEIPHGDPRWMEYFAGWVRGVLTQGYRHGIYCSFFQSFPTWLTTQLQNRSVGSHAHGQHPGERKPPVIWAMRRTSLGNNFHAPFPEDNPSGGSAGAAVWQFGHNGNLAWNDMSDPQRPQKMSLPVVDLNTSLFRDPGIGASSNSGYLTKEARRMGRLRPEFEQKGQLNPAFQNSGQLNPAAAKAGQLQGAHAQSGQFLPGAMPGGQFTPGFSHAGQLK
jgi:hypothetical protein